MRILAWLALWACIVQAASAMDRPSVGLCDGVTGGELRGRDAGGALVSFPLTHTDVTAGIAGMVARATVTQTFTNSFAEPIEAVYVFPLPHTAAIASMVMVIGDRRIVAAIATRADAQKTYDEAKLSGKAASLLEQERPNIFTQTVGNIPPGGVVKIEIGYLDRLAYDSGAYEFHIPLVVGPRYIPGPAVSGTAVQDPALAGKVIETDKLAGPGPSGTGTAADTTAVPDASRITPPVLTPGTRSGHDISIHVELDAGLAITDLKSRNHRVIASRPTPSTATVAIAGDDAIPNKDFVLSYALSGARPQAGVVCHVDAADGGYLSLLLQPAAVDQALDRRVARDLCFLVDVSGSMRGAPLAKAKEAMTRFLAAANPDDRIQVLTFASSTVPQFPTYVPASAANIATAIACCDRQQAGGGTEMLAGVKACLADPAENGRMRMVIMLTDGYIGNEASIISEIGSRDCESIRFWCVGIGSSPNRFLVDGAANAGGGMGVVLGLDDDTAKVVDPMMARIQHAQLSNITIDWGGLPVTDVAPSRVLHLWSGHPIVLAARFHGHGSGVVRLTGDAEGERVSVETPVTLPENEPRNAALRPLWARERIEQLSFQHIVGDGYDLPAEITKLGLAYGLMTQYTSFVAVDASALVPPGVDPRSITQPVPLPAGVSAAAVASSHLGGSGGSSGAFMAIGAGGGSAGMFGSRSGGGKMRALATGGGNQGSVSSVDMALNWFGQHQSANGMWDAVGYAANCSEDPKCQAGAAAVGDPTSIALTAQVTLAFLGAGYDHQTPTKHRPKVVKAIAYLVSMQQPDGSFSARTYVHATATRAICEAYALSGDPALKDPAQRAMKALLARQNHVDGKPYGWDEAAPSERNDTWATSASVLALKAGLVGGLDVGDGLTGAKRWLDAAWKAANPGWEKLDPFKDSSQFPSSYRSDTGLIRFSSPRPAGAPNEDWACTGAMCAAFLGKHAGDPLLETLGNHVIAQQVPTSYPCDPYILLCGSIAMFQIGGDKWKQWNETVRDLVVSSQRPGAGCFAGSWNPAGIGHDSDIGRPLATSYLCQSLEIYYAYAQVIPAKK